MCPSLHSDCDPTPPPSHTHTLHRKGDRIYHQLRKSGCSLDWDRAVFTMDEVHPHSLHTHTITPHIPTAHHYPAETVPCCEGELCDAS